ncbi:MAG: hypothetical protein Q8Q09_04435 [Deltaproteobacteria bacterium]|nr:hypothetical protein [Deltaproteobacteria bacterium]
MKLSKRSALAVLALTLTQHCGAMVAPSVDGGADGAVEAGTFAESPACDQVRAQCMGAESLVVRGHVERLGDLNGHSFHFAVRYLDQLGDGLDHPYLVVRASGVVREGRAEACVCVPTGANNYPQIAATVVRPGATEIRADNTVRAAFSRRYATLGDEGFDWTLTGAPSRETLAAGLAAMDSRGFTLTLRGRSSQVTEGVVRAGLVGAARPVAFNVARAAVGDADLALRFVMPGRALSDESVALWHDRNGNDRCDEGDRAAFVALQGRTEVRMDSVPWAQGATLTSVCDALVLNGRGEN